MNTLLKALALHLTLSSPFSAFGAQDSCKVKKNLLQGEEKHSLCFIAKDEQYISPECKTIESCFNIKNVNLEFRQDQSPGFSLCYQIGGRAFFGVIEGEKDKIPMCEYKEHFVDQESLLIRRKALKKASK